MATLAPTIFREYDIRGRLGKDELNPSSVAHIAKAYGTMLQKRGIEKTVIGYDFRPGSVELTQVFIDSILTTGIDVIALGMVLTPIMYSAQYYYQTKGGVMVTASHNPSGWIGFKLALGFSYTLGPEDIAELKMLTESEEYTIGAGKVESVDFVEKYFEDLLRRVNINRSVRVVVNSGNGTAGLFAPKILRKAGAEVFDLYNDLDENFPHYFPNPSVVEMMEDTGKAVLTASAEIGLAFDGDGDRLGVTDELGNVIWPDRYMALLSRAILKDSPGAKIIFDVKCSRALEEDIFSHGGSPIMWKTGHSYIKMKLAEENAALGGEMSGHIFYGEPIYKGFDDALFAALKLVELLSNSDDSFSQLIAQTPHYFSTPTLNVECGDLVKYAVVEKIVVDFVSEGYKVNTLNGARVEFDDGWALVRPSSNLPVLVLRFEAKTEDRLEELMQLFREKFAQFPEIGDTWISG